MESVVLDVTVPDLPGAVDFYQGFLGLSTEEFSLGWVARYTSPETGAHLQAMTTDQTAPLNPVATLKVDDVEGAYAEAQRRGYEIVHPLSDESWGITRFFVRAPDGNVYNIAQHTK